MMNITRRAQTVFQFAALPSLLTGIPAVAAQSLHGLPTLNYDHIGAYQQQMESLDNPRAQAILRQIERGPADLAQEMSAARREDIPLDTRQLQQPLPPASENAAPLYHQLMALEQTHPLNLPEYANGLSTRYSYTLAQLNAVRKPLHDRKDVMDLVHRIGDRPRCVFQHVWGKGDSMLFPEYVGLRHVARILKTESYLLARQGRYDEAIKDEVQGFRVAEHAGTDPFVMSYLVSASCENIALSGMKDILYLAGPKEPGVDVQVARAVALHHSRISLRDSLRGETAFAMAQMEPLRREGPKEVAETINTDDKPESGVPLNALTPAESRFFNHLVDAQAARLLHLMRCLIAVADKPEPIRRAVFAQAGNEDSENPIEDLAGFTMPIYGTTDQRESSRRAQEQVVLAGAAILQRRAQTGQFPVRLPGRFIDPFTGRSLLYHREGKDGFVVSSAGLGGERGRLPSYQIFFRFPAPAGEPVPPPFRRGWPPERQHNVIQPQPKT